MNAGNLPCTEESNPLHHRVFLFLSGPPDGCISANKQLKYFFSTFPLGSTGLIDIISTNVGLELFTPICSTGNTSIHGYHKCETELDDCLAVCSGSHPILCLTPGFVVLLADD